MTEFQRAGLLRLLALRDQYRRLGKSMPPELHMRALSYKFKVPLNEVYDLEAERKKQ